MKKISIEVISSLIIIATLFSSGCASAPATPTPVPDAISVQLSWFHGVEYAGFYTAVEKGYYAEENIAITLNAGGPDINPLDEVKNGNSQFGISSGGTIIIAKTNQQNFVSVATIFRENPLVITSLTKDEIKKPEDLNGKTIGVYSLDLSNFYDLPFMAFMSRTGLDRASMNYALIEDFEGANEIKAGNMDAMSGMFATDQQVMAKNAGDELNFIYYKDYGYDVYINTIFTTDEFKQSNPELIRRFIRATMKGYEYAIANTEESAGIAIKYDPSLDLAYQQEVMKAQIPFINTGNAPIGSMDMSVWAATQEILLEFGLTSEPIDLNTIYTNDFVIAQK